MIAIEHPVVDQRNDQFSGRGGIPVTKIPDIFGIDKFRPQMVQIDSK